MNHNGSVHGRGDLEPKNRKDQSTIFFRVRFIIQTENDLDPSLSTDGILCENAVATRGPWLTQGRR
jgi:hypothetical protein